MTDAPAPLPLAWFWATFHARRNLRKRAFRGWAVACVLAYLTMRVGGRVRASEAAEQTVFYVIPLLGLFFGGGVLREEIEDQTVTYGFTRPLGRRWIYAARVVAAMVPVTTLALPFLLHMATELDGVTGLRLLLGGLLSALAYTSVFALLGLLLKWSTWVGLAWLLVWESLVSLAPGFIGQLTLNNQLRGVTGFAPPKGLLSALWRAPDPVLATGVLLGVSALALYLGGALVRRREIALEK